MPLESHEICKACSFGNPRHKHNHDSKHCRFGRLEALLSLPEKNQVETLRTMERLEPGMADMIIGLANERKKTVLEVMKEEGLA